jgi:hypothetical protein
MATLPPTPVAHVYPLRRADVNVRVVDGETVVLDRRLRQVHQLNVTASHVWERCDGRHAVTDIAEDLVEAFDVDAETAERDAAATVEQLARVGLLQQHLTSAGALPAVRVEEE